MNLDKRLFEFIRSSQTLFYFTIFIEIIIGICVVLQARTLSNIVNQVYINGAMLNEVIVNAMTLLALIFIRAVLVWSGELSANQIAAHVKNDLRTRLFNHIQSIGPAKLVAQPEFSTGELSNVITEGVEALDSYFRQYLPQIISAAIIPMVYLIFIFRVDPLSGLILLLTAPLIPIFMVLIGSRANELTKRQWRMLSRMSAYLLDVLQGITTLKIFDRSRAQIEVISVVSNRYRNTTLGILRVTFLSALVLEMVSTLSTAIVAVEIGLRLLTGQFSFEQAFFVLLLAPEFYLPLRMLGTRFHAGMAGIEAANSIFNILETKISISDSEAMSEGEPQSVSYTKTTKFSTIQFEDVHCIFSDQRAGLNGITFDINYGETVALVGSSGSGKSTVTQLLLRFLEPTIGQIIIDSCPLSQILIDEWRNTISWVPQSPYLFNDTIEANIHLARPNASHDDVIQAASLAYAHNFIRKLPDSYNTIIGERGMYLSGGQAQRIALARAFLKNAPLLILDEATAHLDPELATQIQKSITHLMKGRTTLLIAHSLFTLTNADKIHVLDSGRLIESGTHKTLSHQESLYKNLISTAGVKP